MKKKRPGKVNKGSSRKVKLEMLNNMTLVFLKTLVPSIIGKNVMSYDHEKVIVNIS